MVLIQISECLPGKYCDSIVATVLDKVFSGVQKGISESQTPRKSLKKVQTNAPTPFLALYLQELGYTDTRGATSQTGL